MFEQYLIVMYIRSCTLFVLNYQMTIDERSIRKTVLLMVSVAKPNPARLALRLESVSHRSEYI
jgi:hypothetical protein